jgi:hypothetical protein
MPLPTNWKAINENNTKYNHERGQTLLDGERTVGSDGGAGVSAAGHVDGDLPTIGHRGVAVRLPSQVLAPCCGLVVTCDDGLGEPDSTQNNK